MVDLSEFIHKPDPTLEKLNSILESEQQLRTSKNIGFGAIGHPCRRKLWYDINIEEPEVFKNTTLRIFRNGHNDEALMISDLQKIPGIELHDKDPERGNKQFKLDLLEGRLTGRLDGAIRGLIQSPFTWHVYEHKSTNQKKFDNFNKIKQKNGEKETLRNWDEIYFAQAQLNMYASGMERHYITVSTPGVRDVTSARTEVNKSYAQEMERKAEYIITAKIEPDRISNDKESFGCKFCRWKERCHGKKT